MKLNFNEWHEALLAMDTSQNHKQLLAEIELIVLESSAADCRKFRLQALWLLRHLAKLV